jgi:hypothetical protein
MEERKLQMFEYLMLKMVYGARSTYGERRGVYRVLVGRPEGKRPLVKSRRR